MKDKILWLLTGLLLAMPMAAWAYRTTLVTESSHEDLVFFEGKKSCATTATQLDARVVANVSFINNSGGSIYVSDDSSVASTDTEIKDGGSMNSVRIQNMNQVWCIAVTTAKDLHFVGLEGG